MSETAAAAAAEKEIELERDGPPEWMTGSRHWSTDEWIGAINPAPGWILIEGAPASKIIKLAGNKETGKQTLAIVRKVGEEAYNHRSGGRQPLYYKAGDVVMVNGDAVTQYPEWRPHNIAITYYEHLLGTVDQVASAAPSLEPSPSEGEAPLPDTPAKPAPSLIGAVETVAEHALKLITP